MSVTRTLSLVFAFSACLAGCADKPLHEDPGSLALALTTQAQGVSYRLADAHFVLTGPVELSLAGDDVEVLTAEAPAGAYGLSLLDGWSLVRTDDPSAAPIEARLVSENPAPVVVSAGERTQVMLRFELADGSPLVSGNGSLAVGIEVAEPGADASTESPVCPEGLRIDELDYEEPGSDTAELVEIVNAASYDAPLEGVLLELVNGSDGRVYARYPLHDAVAVLAPGERLVVASPALITSLPETVARLPLSAAGLQNGPDAVRLVCGSSVLDAVSYEGTVMGASEGKPLAEDKGEGAYGRCPDGADSNDNASDFRLLSPTPGAPNQCG